MGTQDGLSVGGVVGDTYRVTRLLGRGGMGAVWAAEHLRLPGREVAVKVLLSPGVASDESFARFRREAEIASRLGHPHIVQVLDFHTLPSGEPYIVLELLRGETLARRLQRGPVPLEETLAIARQVGSALQAAHRAGVVHRDLKPDNVFLCTPQDEVPGPRVKVLDFGISKIRGSQTVATQDAVLMGTPQYMAPEQALGRNTAIDARTDVFALGAILYEMLGGRPAFGGSSLAEVVYKVVHALPQPLAQLRSGLPLNILSAVDRALQKDPAHRPADVSSFVAELTGRPLTVPATSVEVSSLDATLASPARAVPLSSADTDPTYTPATPIPTPLAGAPRNTEPMPAPAPAHPWATPPAPARVPSPWPAPTPPVPRAPLVSVGGAAPLALAGVKPARRFRGWLIGLAVALAFVAVFRGSKHKNGDDEEHNQSRKGQAGTVTAPTLPVAPVPPAPPLPPEAAAGLKQGLAGMRKGIQQALGKTAEQVEEAKRLAAEAEAEAEAAEEEERARAEQEQARVEARAARDEARAKRKTPAGAVGPGAASAGAASAGPTSGVRELLSDAAEALDDDDPKLALRLAEQSFFIRKTSAGWAIKARAHCQLKDLGNARAALGNVTSRADRGRVLAECAKNGIVLK